jgi:hypothetical protein
MKTNENIELLLRQFMDQAAAEQAAQELHAGDRLFDEFPAPRPDAQTVEALRSKIRHELQKPHHASAVFSWLAMAAAIIIVFLAGVYTLAPKPLPKTVSSPPVYVASNSGNLWNQLSSHATLLSIDRELTDVAESIDAIESENKGTTNILTVDLLELEELELITLNTDFWKG